MATTTDDDTVDDIALLEQAQFLTAFQRFYSYAGTPSLESISPRDLRQVFEYRRLCQEVEDLEEDVRVSMLYNGEKTVVRTSSPLVQAKTKLELLKDNSRLMQCAALVERFEVWTCKALSKHLLLSHQSDTECSSKLLHIPTASRMQDIHAAVDNDLAPRSLAPFAEIWNAVYKNENADSEHFCGLGIPPDVFTWPEFLRVAYMISLLPHEALRQQVHSSLCIQGTKEHKERCSVKFHFRLTDLVALWCRSLYCSMSKRHLLSLFVVTREEEEEETGREPKSETTQTAGKTRSTARFTAVYKGNHRSAGRCFSEHPLVNKIVEYAVLNQVFFTQQKLLHAWKHALQNAPPERPSRPPVSSKRKRHTQVVKLNEWYTDRLTQACQSYILRNFCRRHPIVCVLMYADIDEYQQVHDILFRRLDGVHREIVEPAVMFHHPQAGDLIRGNVLGLIRQSPPYSAFSDRKIPRIDRRIGRGQYKDTKEGDLFYHNVSQLLKTLGSCATILGFDSPEFKIAVSDFRKVYRDEFCAQVERDGLYVAAQSLLSDDWYERYLELPSASEPETHSEQKRIVPLENLLKSMPRPWVDTCDVCEGKLLKSKDQGASASSLPHILICACCERFVHPSCAGGNRDSTTIRVRSFVKRYEPLNVMYRMSIPTNAAHPPDFRHERAGELRWDMKVIELRRTLQPDGSLPVYGMVIKTTQQCADALDRLLSGSYLVSDFDGTTDYPVAFSGHSGCVISDVVAGSPSDTGGCQVGDLIVAITPLDIAVSDGDEEVKFLHSESYTLAKLSYDQVMSLLRIRATKLRMVVARPHGSVAREIFEWTRQVKAANEALIGSLHANESLWFCANCHVESHEATEQAVERIVLDARHCLAVIRRLQQESYARHWLNEDHVPMDSILNYESEDGGKVAIAEVHASCVSLARLECMMQWVVERSNAPETISSFFVGNRRLEWAPENISSDPFKLLCRGMGLIARAPLRSPAESGGATETLSERTTLLSLFLRLFCSWCLGPTLSSHDPFVVKSPPLYALTFREQAENLNLCPKCLVRHGARRCGDVCVLCQELSRLPWKPPPLDTWARSYEARASLVGATILVLPKDPIAADLSKILRKSSKIKLEHNDRPIEYVVVSYLPSRITSVSDPTVPCLEGTYHLLPVVNPTQLKLLLELCKLRQDVQLSGTRGKVISDETLHSWAYDGLLNLAGVLSLTYEELLTKMDETTKIEQLVTLEVALQAGCDCDKTLRSALRPVEGAPSFPCLKQSCKAQELVSHFLLDRKRNMLGSQGSILVEALVQTRSPLFLAMLQQVTKGKVLSRPSSPQGLFEEDSDDTLQFLDPLISWEGRKVHDAASQEIELLRFVHPPERPCRLLYSDIVLNDGQSPRVNDLQPPPDPSLYAGDMWTDHLTAVVLSKNSPAGVVAEPTVKNGIGWGVELVQWENDCDRVRIGRVVVGSPADLAGLQGADEVASINGKPLDILIRDGELMNAMLSLGSKHQYRHLTHAVECAKCTLVDQGKMIGPIILGIKRKVAKEKPKPPKQGESPQKSKFEVVDLTYFDDSEPGLKPTVFDKDTHRTIPVVETAQAPTLEHTSHMRRVSAPSGQQVSRSVEIAQQNRRHSLPSSPVDNGNVARRARSLEMPISRHNAIPSVHPPVGPSTSSVPQRSGLPPLVHCTYTRPYNAQQALGVVEHLYHRLSYVIIPPPLITHNDVYKPGLPGSVLSLLETSVLAKAVLKNLPMLGLRMLSPRYHINHLYAELHFLAKHDELDSVPRIDDELFTKLTRLDFKRSEKEQGEVAFDDKNFFYRMPTSRFPVDRLIESHFSLTGFSFDTPTSRSDVVVPTHVEQQSHVSNQWGSHVNVHSNHRAAPGLIDMTAENGGEEPDRIRGGGNSRLDLLWNQYESSMLSPVHLGTLPDSRKVLWFHCDTRALYVSPGMIDAGSVDERGRQLSYQQDIHKNFSCSNELSKLGPGSLDWWCVWGCSHREDNGQQCCISFASSGELHAHIQSEHSFCHGNKRLDRVAEGDGVRRLLSAITIAACARSSDFLRLTIPSNDSNQLRCFDGMCLNDDVENFQCSPNAYDLLTLARNIMHLFDSSGTLCLDAETLAELVSAPIPPLINEMSTVEATNQSKYPVIHRQPQCPVCDLGTEPVVEMESESPGSSCKGLGCSSYTAVCFGIKEEFQTETTDLKSQLLSAANSIPEAFRVNGSCPGSDVRSHLWSGDHLTVWTDYVLQSRCIESLCQAFVILLLSVDLSKLPTWWDVGGWHDAQLLMQKTSPSALLLHLRVLNAAIAEAAALALSEDIQTPSKGLKSENISSEISFDEIVKKWLKFASEVGIRRWEGESEELCAVCFDGGDLYCCELCPNVCHRQCVVPPIDKDIDDFVCNACLVDLRRLAAAMK